MNDTLNSENSFQYQMIRSTSMSNQSHQPQSIPNLEDIRQDNDGGAIAVSGFDYQFHFAAQKCLEMLEYPDKYEFVSSETHEDVVVRLKNGTYEFYQVKQRATEQWNLSDLKSRNVWTNFIKLRDAFGPNNSFWFVSDQTNKFSSARGKRNRIPDLGYMKKLTFQGEKICNQNAKDRSSVDTLLSRLDKDWSFNNLTETEAFFWNIRILTDYNRESGLESNNIRKLQKILEMRGINADSANLARIYEEIINSLRKSVKPPATATSAESIELRKVRPHNIEICISGPFIDAHLTQFVLDEKHDEPQRRTLRQKTKKLNSIDPKAVEYFISSRNFFAIKFRQQQSYAASYIAELRHLVWGICHRNTVMNGGEIGQTYAAILNELEKLADQQQRKNVPVDDVDREYLHGMMCQLTAECHYEWHCWNNSK